MEETMNFLKTFMVIVSILLITLCFTGCPSSPKEYTITASSGPNGSIDPSGEITVIEGDNQSFTMLPNSDASILDVTVDGASIGVVSSYVFSDVTEDHTIHVTFLALSGSWSGPLSVDGEDYTLYADFVQTGDSLGGTAELYYDQTPVTSYNIDLTIEGDSLSGEFLGAEQGIYDWDVNATVNEDGTEMTGSLYIPDSQVNGTFTLTLAKTTSNLSEILKIEVPKRYTSPSNKKLMQK